MSRERGIFNNWSAWIRWSLKQSREEARSIRVLKEARIFGIEVDSRVPNPNVDERDVFVSSSKPISSSRHRVAIPVLNPEDLRRINGEMLRRTKKRELARAA